MKKELLDAAISFKEAYQSDPRFLRLKESEEAALSSPEVLALHQKMETIMAAYQEALSHNSPNKAELEHELHLAKLALDNHPLMKEYNEAFVVVRDLQLYFDDILFGPFNKRILTIGGKDA